MDGVYGDISRAENCTLDCSSAVKYLRRNMRANNPVSIAAYFTPASSLFIPVT